MDSVKELDWLLRNFDSITPYDKSQFMMIIHQIYIKYHKSNIPGIRNISQMEELLNGSKTNL